MNPGRHASVVGGVQRAIGREERPRVVEDGDEAFVRSLWAEHGEALLGYAGRLVGDRGRAEDIVQEALLRAWRHADELDPSARPLRPWLFTVVSHLATDEHRQRSVRPQEVGDRAAEHLAVPDDVDRAVERWEVIEALGKLSPEHRAVLVETYYRGRSMADAAQVLGIPAGTVKSRTYYALQALRLTLEERGWSR
jgi:RNA polymerase sigma-70 factor (ECF subfamily)